MSFINVQLGDEVREQEPVDEGNYILIIDSVGEDPSKAGKPMLTVMHLIEDKPEAMAVYHYLPLPCEEDEPKARNFKMLNLKRYLTLTGIEYDETEGFASEDLYGVAFSGFLSKEEIEQEDETAPPMFRNVLKVPKLQS